MTAQKISHSEGNHQHPWYGLFKDPEYSDLPSVFFSSSSPSSSHSIDDFFRDF